MIEATNGRIRILFVIGTLDVGGAERQLVEIATHMDPSFEPAVCSLSDTGPLARDLESKGVPVFAAGLRGVRQHQGWARIQAASRLPGDLLGFFRHVREFQPHVLHGFLFHSYVLGAFAARRTGVPVVVASRRSLSNFKQGRRSYALAEQAANRRTDLVIANSEAVRRDAIETEGLAADKVIVIYNGLDLASYERTPSAELRQSLGVGAGPVILTVANLIPYKGHTYLLNAFAEVLRTWSDASLLLAGDGAARNDLKTQAAALGMAGRVKFLGVRRDVADLLAVSDVLAHPSLEEGFCNAIIEAMAARRPVVATDVGGNREAITDGSTGYLVPPRDATALASAILRVLAMPDRGSVLGQAGRARAEERFATDGMVRRYESVYRDLLALKGTDVRDRRTS